MEPSAGPGQQARDSFEALWAAARKEGDPPDYQPYLKTIYAELFLWQVFGVLTRGTASLKLVSLPVDTADETNIREINSY